MANCQAPKCTWRALSDSNYCGPHRDKGEAIEAAMQRAVERGMVELDGISENGKFRYRSLIYRQSNSDSESED